MDQPSEVYWSNGRIAMVDDYRRHQGDTQTVLDELPHRYVVHMLPDIEAELRYEGSVGCWVLEAPGYRSIRLDVTDPHASDDELLSEVYTLTTVFRFRVKRS